MATRRKRKKTPEELVETLDDHKALERHRFLLASGKALLTMVNLIVMILVVLYVYSAIKNNEMPKTSDMVELLGGFFSATVKMIGISA